MLLSGFIINSSTLEKSVDSYFEDTNLADLWIYTDKVDETDIAFFEKLENEQNIQFEPRLYFEVPAKISSAGLPNSSKIYVSKGAISTPYVESTSYLDLGKRGCIIDKNVAKNYGVEIRVSKISFSFDYAVAGNNITLDIEAPINGTMCLDECSETYSSWPIFFSEEEFLRLVNEQLLAKSLPEIAKIPYNQVLIKTEEPSLITNLVNDYYKTSDSKLAFLFDRNQMESVVMLEGEVSQSKKMIYVFPIIFLIVSILIILTTTNQLILQEQMKIGTLKSIGVPDKKILTHYSMYGTILVAIGSVLGVLLGWLIIPSVMFVKYNLVYSIPDDYIKINIPWIVIVLVFVFMVGLGYLVSHLSCRNILHKKPIECLRRDIKLNDTTLRSKPKASKKIPLPIKMAVRNVRLKPLRTLMATLGIAGCTALLLCGFGVGDTLVHSKNNDLEKLFRYDISSTYVDDSFLTKLETLDDRIEEVELYQQYYVQAVSSSKTQNITVFQIEPNSKLSMINLTTGQNVLSKNIANELGVKVGDSVTISSNGRSKVVVISELIETSVFSGLYVCDSLGFDKNLASKGVWIGVSGDVDEVVKRVNSINGTNTALSKSKVIEKVDNKISSIDIMTTTLKVFAILLAVVVLLNLIFLILKERHKEIATLKVLGQENHIIGLSVLCEILIMAILGLFLGMCLGYPLLILLLSINKVEVFNFLYYLSPLSFVYATLILLVTIFSVFALCQIKIKNINMIESLKSVE